MSKASDFFAAGGGGNFALGLAPPAKSLTFKELGNTSYSDGSIGGSFDSPVDKGRVAPVAGTTYDALAIPVRNNTQAPLALGQWPQGGSTWGNTPGPGVYGNRFWMGGFYFSSNTTPGDLYSLNGFGYNGRFIDVIYKTSMIDGSITQLLSFAAIEQTDDTKKPFLYPLNEADPDNSDWVITYQKPVDFDIAARVVRSDGTISEEILLTVDKSGTNQTFRHNGGYLSADGQILASNFAFGAGLGNQLSGFSMVVTRGSASYRVHLPMDGSAPTPNVASIQDNFSLENVGAFVWGDSVIFMSDAAVKAGSSFIGIYGRRIVDRADFDRWLHEICDFYGLPSGENYLPVDLTIIPENTSYSGGAEINRRTVSDDDAGATSPWTCVISSDRLGLLVASRTPVGELLYYTLSEPGDLSSATYRNTIDIGTTYGADYDYPQSIALANNDTKLYVAANSIISRMTAGLGVTSLYLSADSNQYNATSLGESNIRGLVVAEDESYLYITGSGSDDIIKLVFGTPGDLTTLTEVGRIDISSYLGSNPIVGGLYVAPDETKVFVSDNGSKQQLEFSMSTPGDITTLSGLLNSWSWTYNFDFDYVEETNTFYVAESTGQYISESKRGVA